MTNTEQQNPTPSEDKEALTNNTPIPKKSSAAPIAITVILLAAIAGTAILFTKNQLKIIHTEILPTW